MARRVRTGTDESRPRRMSRQVGRGFYWLQTGCPRRGFVPRETFSRLLMAIDLEDTRAGMRRATVVVGERRIS